MTQQTSIEVEMGWMAAVIAPRDVSPHPNFWSSEPVTPYGVLGLLQEGRHSDYARLLSDRERGKTRSTITNYDPLFDAVAAAMSVGTVSSGAKLLADIARGGLVGDDDLALRVACAVMAATTLIEVNRSSEARVLLAGILLEVEEHPGWEKSFLSLWLLNVDANAQQSMHYRTAEFVARAQQVVSDAGVLRSAAAFNVSLGSSVSPQECLQDIWDVLTWGAAQHAARAQSDWSAQIELVRRPTPRLAWRIRGRVGESLEVSLKEEFRATLSRPGERRVTIGEEPDGDSELFESLTWHENVGSPFVRHYRGLLGRARFLRGIASAEDWLIAEGIRLLRHADLDREVDASSRFLRQQGPLHLLRGEGQQVLESIDFNGGYSLSDLVLIRHAAPLLDSRARDFILARLFADRVSHDSPRLEGAAGVEKAWQAIYALSVAGKTDSAALEVLLDEINRNHEGEQVDEYAYARALGLWSVAAWEHPKVRSRLSAMTDTIHTSNSVELKRAIDLAADRLAARSIGMTEELNLQTVARYVDRAMLHSTDIPIDVIPGIESLLRAQLAATRKDAREGRFSGGGLSGAELAVALMFVASSADLWSDVLDFVLDPVVQRDDKTAALNRMASRAKDLPREVIEELRRRSADLLEGGPEFMGSAVRPYPAGVRLLAMVGGLGVGAPLSLVAELMAKGTPASRHEAGVTLVALAHRGEKSEWFESICLWLTYDADVNVRSLAGQALAITDARWNGAGRNERLAVLLQEDGTLVPLHILAGLKDANKALPESLQDIIVSLVASHMSTEVRQAARAVLDRPNVGDGPFQEGPKEGIDAQRWVRNIVGRGRRARKSWFR